MWTWLSKFFTISPQELRESGCERPAPRADAPAPHAAICDPDIRYDPHFAGHLLFRTEFIGWQDDLGDLHFFSGIPAHIRARGEAFATPRRQHIRATLRAQIDPQGFSLQYRLLYDVVYRGITIGRLSGTYLTFKDGVPWRVKSGAKSFLAPEIARRQADADTAQAVVDQRRARLFSTP